MARTGLRMMPTFPSPPLKFRKAGFPRSGFKANVSDRAFPSDREFVAAVGLRPSFVLSASTVGFPVLCRRNVARLSTAVRAAIAALPQGPSLRSELFCLGPSSLTGPIRPTCRHISISPLRRLIRDALAVRFRLGDPRVVPCFHCTFLLHMPPSMTAGSSSAALAQFLHR
jgi:hypothetical protein